MKLNVSNNKLNLLLICAVSILIYLQTTNFDLVFCDDHDLIITDLNKITDFSEFPGNLFEGYLGTNYFRPIIIFSFMIDYMINGDSAVMYHITNILLHTIFCLLLYIFLLKFKLKLANALISTLFFAVHPIFSNSVAWIVGRNDIIFSLFSILAYFFLIKYHDDKKNKYLFIHSVSLFLAFLSKETALVVPLIFILYLFISENKNELKKFVPIWSIIYIIFFALRYFADLGNDINNFGFDIFLANLRVYPEFFSKAFIPVNLSVLPTYMEYHTYFGLIIIALLIFISVKYSKNSKDKFLILGLFWLIIVVLPGTLISLKNASEWNDYLDTRFYFAAVGLILILNTINWKRIFNNSQLIPKIIITIFLVFFTMQNIRTTQSYKNSLTFYRNAVENDDSRVLFNYILSKLYIDLNNYDEAEKLKLRTVELQPDNSKYNFDLAMLYYNTGKIKQAIQFLNRTIDIDSSKYDAYNLLGKALMNQKQTHEAIDIWEKAVGLFPNKLELFDNLSYAYLVRGNIQQAISYSDRIINKDYNSSNLSNDFINYAEMVSKERNLHSDYILLLERAANLTPNNPVPYEKLIQYFETVKIDLNKAKFYTLKLNNLKSLPD